MFRDLFPFRHPGLLSALRIGKSAGATPTTGSDHVGATCAKAQRRIAETDLRIVCFAPDPVWTVLMSRTIHDVGRIQENGTCEPLTPNP